jgi:hypothetical protein
MRVLYHYCVPPAKPLRCQALNQKALQKQQFKTATLPLKYTKL